MQATEDQNKESGQRVEDIDLDTLKNILEGALLAAARPLSLDRMQALFGGDGAPEKASLRQALKRLEEDCENRAVELVEVASGFRLQVRQEFQTWISRLFEEKPQRYSRALLETLALIAYRQPITRGEIEEVRGVSVSTNIIRTLEEREWVRVVGYRDVPGKPALYGTTREFLDYFGLKNLEDLPTLAEIRDIGDIEPEFDFSQRSDSGAPMEGAEGEASGSGEGEATPESAEVDDPHAGPGDDEQASTIDEAPAEEESTAADTGNDDEPMDEGAEPSMDEREEKSPEKPDESDPPRTEASDEAGDSEASATGEESDAAEESGSGDADSEEDDQKDEGRAAAGRH